MKKYIIAGIAGFLIHAAWIVGGTTLLDYNSPLNIARQYGEIIDQQSILAAFVRALLISIIFLGIVRLSLIRSKYNAKERWVLGFAAGAGFHLAFWALVGLLWAIFSGYWS